ncbi:MAG TPA: VOC family protein [Acidimicrobiia bacterium]|nr:VOC family protein [Acidimicrobiia bacterium]
MKVTRVLHVSVNVEHHLSAAQDFYSTLFGLASKPRPEVPGISGHWFALGDAELHLVDATAGPSGIKPAGNHFCVAVDDLDAAVAELDERNIEYVRGSQGDVVQIWIVDPTGNTIELQQDRDLA